MNDQIIDEIRSYREKYARKFNFDLDRIFADLKKKEDELRKQGFSVVGHQTSQPKKKPTKAQKRRSDKSI